MFTLNNLILLLTTFLLFICISCEEEICGPAEIETPQIILQIQENNSTSLSFGNFSASPNNDCTPVVGDPTSITVDGSQDDNRSFHLGFCLPRPHKIGNASIDLSNEELFTELYVNGSFRSGNQDCSLRIDRSKAMNGTITFHGLCSEGTHADGFSMTIDGTIGGIQTCSTDSNDVETEIEIRLSGEISVANI